MKSAQVRSRLVEALRVDLVGPGADSELAEEVLDQAPSRWYLTGFLVPLEAGVEQKCDESGQDELDLQGEAEDDAPEPPAARRAFFPSSIGISLLVSKTTRELEIEAGWGDYQSSAEGSETDRDAPDAPVRIHWTRRDRRKTTTLKLPDATRKKPSEIDVPESDGLRLAVAVRPVPPGAIKKGLAAEGAWSVSVFLVNRRVPADDAEKRDERFIFQAGLAVRSNEPLIARPNLKGHGSTDWDEGVADLQYRDDYEYAVGHGVATRAEVDANGECRRVRTEWIPEAPVEHVAAAEIAGVELGMEALGGLADAPAAARALQPFVAQYRAWIANQRGVLPSLSPERRGNATELFQRAETAANRIESGIAALADPQALEAFRLANAAMARAARRRLDPKRESAAPAPKWRPFQLAFFLMNLPGIVDPLHPDRETVDLLFFPTGGGKTEAYLGLAAFTLVWRRLKNPGMTSAGLCVLMRYTLRLLTLDQLGRAAALICALELARLKDPDKLGTWPFEIGLWVGRGATPNRMGAKGNDAPNTARCKTIAHQNDSHKPAPIPLENCPWCGAKFTKDSFQLKPNTDHPTDLRMVCANRECDFNRGRSLPILTVDEPIYRRLPCFMIATVDKFAAMPWTGAVGGFFGRVDRYDGEGFYGPTEPNTGRPLPVPLLPPDLIIQDELHLISGPMGTMVGLYETALDALCSRPVEGGTIRPKIAASTATVRRAESQIRALFNRFMVDVFPPPGPDRRDSFFATTRPTTEVEPRLYLGIAAQGRSLKVVMLRTYLALLGAAQKAYEADGGKRNSKNAADPYMTLLGYFNSLRELGGSRRIVEDEVLNRVADYAARKRIGQGAGLFADRTLNRDVLELTSRVPTSAVSDAKRRLSLAFHDKDRVDAALATNMISVGLDVTRLGMMVVLGQPKTCAEYIQATSRVGRDPDRPGLIVTLLNLHRHRDRSHYERFEAFHRSFYRTVEATSVTPFSPRALDRGLAGALVALARLGHSPMTPAKGASEVERQRASLEFVVKTLSDRAANHAQLEPAEAEEFRRTVRDRANDLLDAWCTIARECREAGGPLQYNQHEDGGAPPLLRGFLDPELANLNPRHKKFRANRSMRDVEPSVNLWLKTLDGRDVAAED